MISDNQIYTKIATAIRTEYPDALVTAESTQTPSKFPCVFIEEIDDAPEKRYETFSNSETNKRSTFEVQVYSDKKSGAKQETKKITSLVKEQFRMVGYRCITDTPVANADSTIKRRVSRFTRIIGSGDTLTE